MEAKKKDKRGSGGEETKPEAGGGGGGSGHWQAAKSIARPKMDVPKALAVLGFSSSRTLDTDAKMELNNALSRQMELLERKKMRAAHSTQVVVSGRGPSIEEKQRDEVRLLHEAYQFLSRKFIVGRAERSESSGGGGEIGGGGEDGDEEADGDSEGDSGEEGDGSDGEGDEVVFGVEIKRKKDKKRRRKKVVSDPTVP